MPSTAKLFALLSELIMFLLGAMLLLLAFTGRAGKPGQPAVFIVLGIVLVYWGVRDWIRKRPEPGVALARVQAVSLALVGALLLLVTLLSVEYTRTLLMSAGAVFALRGLLGGVLVMRQP